MPQELRLVARAVSDHGRGMNKLWKFAAGKVRVVVALCAATAVAQEAVPLITPGSPTAGWTFDHGREFPGATGSLTADPEAGRAGRESLKLTGDFSKGGQYVQAGRRIDRVDIRELSLWIRNPDAAKFVIRINDGSGQTHQIAVKTEATADWQKIVLPLQDFFERRGEADAVTSIAHYESWGGAKDGDWHGPATGIYLLLSNPGARKLHTLWLNDLEILPRPVAVAGAEVRRTVPLDEISGDRHDWGFSLGAEFPGAKGSLAVARDEPGTTRPSFRLAADFSGGGGYVAMIRSLAEVEAGDLQAIRLRVKSDNAPFVGIQFVDGSGQTHQRSRTKIDADGRWHELVLRPAEIAGGEHWGGANDGKWHGRLKQLALSLPNRRESGSAQPVLHLADIRAEVLLPVFAQPAAFREDFEDPGRFPRAWVATEGVAPDTTTAFKGGASLLLSRPVDDAARPCSATGPAFDAAPGLWDLGLASKADLHSPDNSYHAVVTLEGLDAGGQVLERITVAEVFGTHGWEPVKRRVELPQGVVRARFHVQLNKTYGRFWLDEIAAAYLAPSARKDDRIVRALFSTAQVGNLLLPGDPRTVGVTLETRKPLPDGQAAATYEVRDYWGAEQTKPVAVPLGPMEKREKGFAYRASLDLGGAVLETGRYYEVHLTIPQETGEPFRDYTSFAILPPAGTKQFRPEEIPFTSRCWDNRIPDYVRLTDRLGLRVCGIWGGWSAKPPYAAEAPTLDLCEKLGMGWLSGTPIHGIELGKRDYDETALREGVRGLIATFGRVRPMIISLGNEPHGTGDRVRANVEAYRAVYEEVKKADPGVFVLATAVEPNEEYFRLGYGKWCDAFDFHEYGECGAVRKALGQYRELMRKYDCVKPVWSTELGLNSQGQPRLAVARELHRKLCTFFAAGGVNASWFSLLYPDPEGRSRGSSGDAHNVFDCRYSRYAPRLDAIAYYNAVNSIAIKKFVAEKTYAEGISAFLFRDRGGRALLVLWKEAGRRDVFVPLPGAGSVELLRIDGRRRALEADGRGVTLTITEDPLLLLFEGGPETLAADLEAPAAQLATPPASLLRGRENTLVVSSAGDVGLVAPPFWSAGKSGSGGTFRFAVTPPAASAVREADLIFPLADAAGRARGELYFRAPVAAP